MRSYAVDYEEARAIRVVRALQSAAAHDADVDLPDAKALERRLHEETETLGPGGAWLIAWLDYAVVVDAVAPGWPLRHLVDPRWLQELRLFGERGEWRLWRARDGFASRRRLDGVGEESDALDDDQSLWGTRAEPDVSGGTIVSESRGISFRLPAAIADRDLPLRLTVRQYLAYGDDGMVGVADARLVRLSTWQGTPVSLPGSGREG